MILNIWAQSGSTEQDFNITALTVAYDIERISGRKPSDRISNTVIEDPRMLLQISVFFHKTKFKKLHASV